MSFNKFQKISISFLTAVFLLAIGYWLLAISVNAQAKPQFLVSWQAQNYAPYWYQGKILPIKGTPVSISFELIDNGKIADLSKTTVRWYVNDNLVLNENNGLGIKNLKINIPDYSGGQTEIRIVVLDYLPSGMIDKLIEIPVRGAEAIINVPYADRKIKTGSSIFGLSPFFFNIKDLSNLSVDWSVNGQKPLAGGNPYVLDLNIGSETPKDTAINLSVSIKNILKDLEFASQNIQLQVK